MNERYVVNIKTSNRKFPWKNRIIRTPAIIHISGKDINLIEVLLKSFSITNYSIELYDINDSQIKKDNQKVPCELEKSQSKSEQKNFEDFGSTLRNFLPDV